MHCGFLFYGSCIYLFIISVCIPLEQLCKRDFVSLQLAGGNAVTMSDSLGKKVQKDLKRGPCPLYNTMQRSHCT